MSVLKENVFRKRIQSHESVRGSLVLSEIIHNKGAICYVKGG